jgi:hypothetical protein
MLANAVFKEFAEINASHHVSRVSHNYSCILNTENICWKSYNSSGTNTDMQQVQSWTIKYLMNEGVLRAEKQQCTLQ